MQIHILKSKLHRASVTGANVQYEGSLTIDSTLMERAGMHPYERILCGNLANGERFETYLIPGEPGSGAIILNGATAHLGKPGDMLTIMSYTWVEEAQARKWQPKVLVLGKANKVVDERGIRCHLLSLRLPATWAAKSWGMAPFNSRPWPPSTLPSPAT